MSEDKPKEEIKEEAPKKATRGRKSKAKTEAPAKETKAPEAPKSDKIRVEFTEDNDAGFKKGEIKRLKPRTAEILIQKGLAKKA